MPEMTFRVRWPDGMFEDCYSPSLVMHDHLVEGARYTVADFTDRCATALSEASDRVRAKYGFACTSAAQQLEAIELASRSHAPDAEVLVVAMRPPAC